MILDALDRLMEGRTTILIAHRLATLRGVDEIIVMDDGEIVQQGTHEELAGQDGLYRQLWDAQTRGGDERQPTPPAAALAAEPAQPPLAAVAHAGGAGTQASEDGIAAGAAAQRNRLAAVAEPDAGRRRTTPGPRRCLGRRSCCSEC